MLIRVIVSVFAGLWLSASVLASPWIEPGEARTRHHIQYLVDSGALNLPTTTWPLAWASVKQGLNDLSPKSLNANQAWSVSYLEYEFEKNTRTLYTQSRSHISGSTELLKGFESTSREQKEVQTGIVLTSENVAMKLTGTYVDDPSDGKKGRMDGSYLAGLFGNWAAGFGAVNQWWGPGWHNSLILSNNARPAPGIFIRRIRTDISENTLLRWLGQSQFTTFANELQTHDYGDDKPIMWGARFNFSPIQGFEIGLSNTAIWAGEYAPKLEGVETPKTEAGRSKQSSLEALDLRYGFRVGVAALALYGQAAKEHERSSPSDDATQIGLAGIELSLRIWDIHSRLSLEASNSVADFNGTPKYNQTYSYRSYPAGYRHFDRAMGVNTDSDSEIISLAGQHYFQNGHFIRWRYSHATLNRDGKNSITDSGSAFSDKKQQVGNTQIEYRAPINDRLMAEIGASYLNESLMMNDELLESSLHFSLFHHW